MSVPTPTKKDEKKVGGGPASGVPNVPCPHCPKKFMRGYNMRVHIERVHNKSKPWQCQFCEKTFATTSDLKQHLSSHGMGKIHKVKHILSYVMKATHSHLWISLYIYKGISA